MRILVVDDHIDATDCLALLLKLSGHEVQTAYRGDEALPAAKAFVPEAVMLDIGLPGMDGYEIARRLREEKGLERVCLIAVSGYSQKEDRMRSLDAGFDPMPVNERDPGQGTPWICYRMPTPST